VQRPTELIPLVARAAPERVRALEREREKEREGGGERERERVKWLKEGERG
jgi:hypothetical protein